MSEWEIRTMDDVEDELNDAWDVAEKRIAELERQRDALLEACRMFVDAYTHEALDLAHSKAQAAIAKAEGK